MTADRKQRAAAALLGAPLLAALALGCGGGSSGAHEPPTRRVIEAASASGEYAYAFDPSGLVTRVGTSGAAYTVTRQGDTMTAGADTYRYDALGRVAAIDDLTIAYGPDGQIDHATRGGTTVAYVHDEEGRRLLKSTAGAPVAAYVEQATLTAAELDEPLRIGARLLGVLRNGVFSLTATDARGTVQADTNGAPRYASPFGARPVHPDVAAALDYTARGYDADLGADRMGVRDYDARVARFLQPDPLFLAHPEKCVQSPVECSLYGYARSSPADYTDPTGTHSSKDWHGVVQPVHQDAIRIVLGASVTPEQLQVLVDRQTYMDTFQHPEDQPLHAMNGLGQDRGRSIQVANRFVAEEMKQARAEWGKSPEAFEHLGNLLHTLQDATSPAHSGFQTYYDGFPLNAIHGAREAIYPVDKQDRALLEGATRWGYDMAAGKAPVPDHFFDAKTGQLALPDRYTH